MDHPKLEEWKTVWRERRSVTMVYILLRISVVLVMLAQIFNGNFENVFLCVLTLILFMMPSVLEKKLDITLPNTLEIIILLFIYAAEIMGEIGAYYVTFPYWDTVLHTLNGFLCAAIGFSLLDILNRHSEARFHLSPLYLAIVAFCFSMTVGVIWEFFECTMDQLFFLAPRPHWGWAGIWTLVGWTRWRICSSTSSVRLRSRSSATSTCAAAAKTSLPNGSSR